MAYQDLYKEYLEQIPHDIEKCIKSKKRILFGYTSDVDVLLQYEEPIVNRMLEEFPIASDDCKADDHIESIEDLNRIIVHHMKRGSGGEFDIVNIDVCNYMLQHFKTRFSLGGTAAQGTMAMAASGMPVMAYISDRSKGVCDFMDAAQVEALCDGKRMPIRDVEAGEPVYHFIFSFTKGDRFRLADEEFTVPYSNRLILPYDAIHKDIHVDEKSRCYLEDNAQQLIAYNISGFNAVLDVDLAKRKMMELGEHYRRIKEKNPNCIIYFESAHYQNPKVKYVVYDEVSKYVDIMGMNEEELVAYTLECGASIDHSNLDDVLRAMELLIGKYRVRGIVMHTKDYSMYYGEELGGADVRKGLSIGNLLSGTRARVGHYGNLKECRENLALPLSKVGLSFAEQLSKKQLKKYAVLIPSRYLEAPICTIGLGDTFVAGFQYGLIH